VRQVQLTPVRGEGFDLLVFLDGLGPAAQRSEGVATARQPFTCAMINNTRFMQRNPAASPIDTW
jgi:hypothetical protein